MKHCLECLIYILNRTDFNRYKWEHTDTCPLRSCLLLWLWTAQKPSSKWISTLWPWCSGRSFHGAKLQVNDIGVSFSATVFQESCRLSFFSRAISVAEARVVDFPDSKFTNYLFFDTSFSHCARISYTRFSLFCNRSFFFTPEFTDF